MADGDQNKTLSEVSGKLSRLNGTTGDGLANVQRLTETLVAQSKASLEATEGAAAGEAEARKEAGRVRKKGLGAQDVNVLNWQKQEEAGMFETLKDMLMMKFAWGGFGLVGLGSAVVAAISGALIGASAGLVVGFLDMWGKIFKFFGGKLAKMFPNVTQTLSNIFGKGGKISQFVASIKAFFTGSKTFQTISNAFLKFKTMLSSFGTRIAKFFKPILSIFSGGGGAMGPLAKFGKHFMTFFRIFKTFFAKLFYPIQIIISLIDGFFEAKDAVGKSKGMMATFFNAIVGFFGGILDGLIMGTLDLIKDGVSWIAGFLGFGDVEKLLDSFSFSDMFNEFLDDIYEWFNLLFSDPVAALSQYFSGLFGGILSIGDFIVNMYKKPLVWLMKLFGWDDAAESTEKFSLKEWVMGKWKSVKDWFTGLLSWGKGAGATEEGGWSFTKFIGEAWQKIKDYFKNLLTFKSENGKEIGIVDKVIEMFRNMIDQLIVAVKGMIPSASDLNPWGDKDPASMSKEDKSTEIAELQADLKAERAKPKAGTGGFFADERDDNSIVEMQTRLKNLQGFDEGGLVKEKGIGMLHGKQSAPELVLDNLAASLFMQAAQLLSKLQLEAIDLRSTGGTTVMNVVNNTPVTTNNSKTIGMMPAPSIRPESPNILPA